MSPEQTLHSLLASYFSDFLTMFVPDCASRLAPASLQPLEGAEAPESLFFQATVDGQEILFYLRQVPASQAVEDLNRQLLETSLRLFHEQHRPVFPIALALEPGLRSAHPGQVKISIGQAVVLDFRYQFVDLSTLSLADFSQFHNPLAVVLMAQSGTGQSDRPRFKLDCLRLLAGMRLDPANQILASGFVDQALPLDPQQETVWQGLLQSSSPADQTAIRGLINLWAEEGYKVGFEEGRNKGLEEGKARGFPAGHAKGFESGFAQGLREGEKSAYETAVARGRTEAHANGLLQGERQGQQQGFSKGFDHGRHDAGVRMTVGTLRRRFGNVPANIIAKINATSPEVLEELADDFWTIADLQDLQGWLRDRTL